LIRPKENPMNTLRPPIAAALLLLAVSLPGPARAAAPAGHYVVSGTGNTATIYDTKSKLTWTKATRLGTWTEAKATCADIGATIGGTGWRLPTFKELLTLLDLSVPTVAAGRDRMDPVFGAIGMAGHWSATPDSNDPTRAWNVNFFYGDTYPYVITNQNVYKCVR
jgi:hypothetical protein